MIIKNTIKPKKKTFSQYLLYNPNALYNLISIAVYIPFGIGILTMLLSLYLRMIYPDTLKPSVTVFILGMIIWVIGGIVIARTDEVRDKFKGMVLADMIPKKADKTA